MIEFPGKQENEIVVAVFRKHGIVFVRSFLVFLVASILPLILFFGIWYSRFPLSNAGTVGTYGYLGACLYFLYSFVLLMLAILDDEFDLFILTDQRLIDITQKGLLKRSVATTPLEQIQDTTSNVDGILATLLNYGNVDVQTSSASVDRFTIDHVFDPSRVSHLILEQAEIVKQKKRQAVIVSAENSA